MTRTLILLSLAALALAACGKKPEFHQLEKPSQIEAAPGK